MKFERYWSRLLRITQEEQTLLCAEGLIKTYPPHAFINALYDKYPNFSRAHTYIEPQNVIVLFASTDISKDVEVKQLSQLTGYVVAHVGASGDRKYPCKVTLEPKWPGEIPQSQVPQHAYHVIPKDRKDKIKQHGLVPRDSQTTFAHAGNRIYLLVTQQPNKDIPLLVRLLQATRGHGKQYLVLRVDTHPDQPYYYDPSMQLNDVSSTCYGVFTLKNILSQDITVLGVI